MATQTSPTCIRLNPTTEARLERLAHKTGRSKSYYVKLAVEEYIEDLEDYFLAEERWKEYLEGKEKAVPLEEVMKEYGMLPH